MVPGDQTAALETALIGCETEQIERLIERFRGDPGATHLPQMWSVLDHVFTGSDLVAMQQ